MDLKLKENISLVNSINWVTLPVTSNFATSDSNVSEFYFWFYQIPIAGYITFLFLVISNSVISFSSDISESVILDSVISVSIFYI